MRSTVEAPAEPEGPAGPAVFDQDLRRLAERMLELMREAAPVGEAKLVAAAQIPKE